MRQELIDIIKHTHDTKLLPKIIVNGTEDSTVICGRVDGMIAIGTTKSVIEEFEGEFTLSNLAVLKGFANMENMGADEATIKVKRRERTVDDVTVSFPEEIIFYDGASCKLNYRCADVMSAGFSIPKERKYDWGVDGEITASKFAELSRLTSILGVDAIRIGVEDSDLVCWLNDENSTENRAKITLIEDVGEDAMTNSYKWGLKFIFAAARLAAENHPDGNIPIKIDPRGLILITSETDNVNFKYYLGRMTEIEGQ